jgi:endoglucanase Acf2
MLPVTSWLGDYPVQGNFFRTFPLGISEKPGWFHPYSVLISLDVELFYSLCP